MQAEFVIKTYYDRFVHLFFCLFVQDVFVMETYDDIFVDFLFIQAEFVMKTYDDIFVDLFIYLGRVCDEDR